MCDTHFLCRNFQGKEIRFYKRTWHSDLNMRVILRHQSAIFQDGKEKQCSLPQYLASQSYCLLYGEQSDLGLDNISSLKGYLPHLLVELFLLWSSHITIHQNHLEGLLNHRFLALHSGFLIQQVWDSQSCISNQCTSDPEAAGLTLIFHQQCISVGIKVLIPTGSLGTNESDV